MAVGVRGVDIFTRNVGKARNGGIGFIMGNFFKPLYMIGRGMLIPFFMKKTLYYLASSLFPFSNFLQSPHTHTHFPVASNLHPKCSFCCPVSLAEWVIMPHATFDVLIYLMMIWIYTCRALVPERP